MREQRGEGDDAVRFWRRTCVVMGALLALSIATICALVAVLVLRTSMHRMELNAVRAQGERDREIVTKMWQVANDELNRLRLQASPAQSPIASPPVSPTVSPTASSTVSPAPAPARPDKRQPPPNSQRNTP